jgi:acetamidase/formamidase
MKIYCVTTVGRQVEGDMVSIRFEQAFKAKIKAEAFAKDLTKVYTENVNTPTGPVQFVLERGIQEVEFDENE